MAFLLDSLKERFDQDDDQEPDFSGLDYRIGATTGKDVGQEPSFLARRTGRFAQFGGETLEILVEDAGTFEVDREEIMDTVSNLGLETVSFHGNPNIGFSSPALQRHDATRSYFTEYLHGFGGLIRAIEENNRYDFDISYVNMHASVNPLPQIQSERQPGGIDIFGKETTNIDGGKKPNIYTNKEFLKTLFDLLRLRQDRDMEDQLYTAFFATECAAFERDWKRARQIVLNQIYDELNYGPDEDDFQREVNLIASAGGAAQGSLFEFRELLEEADYTFPDEITGIPRLQLLPQSVIELKRDDSKVYDEEFRQKLHEVFRDLWKGKKAEIEGTDSEELGLTVSAKKVAIQRAEDIDEQSLQNELTKRAAERQISRRDGQTPHDLARRAFSGDESYYSEGDYVDEVGGVPSYLNIVENIQRAYNVFQSQSGVIYYLIPAWLASASAGSDERDDQELLGDTEGEEKVHEGWDVGEFIWESLVSERGDKDYPSISDEPGRYIDKLKSDAEFRQDVGAASGAGYMWGHFTQIEAYFKPEREDQYRAETESTLRTGGNEMDVKWMEWLDIHDVRVNIESMVNSAGPGQYYLLWRPKDIAVACHAVNIEARSQGFEPPLKFTIDMEHTASFGVDPEQEMELMIENEERLASNPDLDIDENAPLKSILETYHLTRPGFEVRQGHMHGEIRRGEKMVYRYLYRLVENGFCRGDDTCTIAFEIAGNYSEDIYNARVIMDLIELNVRPEELRADRVDASGDYDTREEALMARFFNMDKTSVAREFAAIEANAFNPLKELLEAEDFDNTQLGNTSLGNDVRPQQFTTEEFR